MDYSNSEYPNIGKNIKRLRKEAGLTQQELGERLGVGKAAVSKWEKGTVKNFKSRILIMLSEELNTPLSELLEGREKYFFAKNKRLFFTRIFINEFQYFLLKNSVDINNTTDAELIGYFAQFLTDYRKKHSK